MKIFKNRWVWVGGGVLLVVVAVLGAMQSRKGKTQQVTVTPAKSKDVVMTVKAPGAIEPRTTVKISADIPGRVRNLAVNEGDQVKRGQLLLELDNTQYDANVHQAQASIGSSRARLAQAQASWKIAQAQYDRRKALFDRKLLSTQEMDTAENEYVTARTALDESKEELSRLEAALVGARDVLSKTTYRAPIDGTIVALNIEEGEIVVTGTMNNAGTQILTVADLSRMLVKADVDETDVIDVRPGQAAKITVDAFPDTTFGGTVTEVGNSANTLTNTTGSGEKNFEVKVLFSQTVPEIRPGMTADVEIEAKRAVKALAVPIQSVVVRMPEDLQKRGTKARPAKEPKGGDAIAASDDDDTDSNARKKRELTGVFVLVGDHAEFRKIKTGISSETDIQVLPGGELKAGERVVTGPYKVLRDLKPGDRLEVQKKGRPGKGAKARS